MPPKISANTRVSELFITTMLHMYGQWIKQNERIIMQAGRGGMAQRMAMTARRLLPIVRRQSPSLREGFDYEVTRLKRMPYTSFDVVMDANPLNHHEKIAWLVGTTRHITMRDYHSSHSIMGEMGCYNVCIPSSIIHHPNMAHIHMLPVRNPHAPHRHPHHAGFDRGIRGGSPLTWETGNCWGSYSGVIKGLIDEPDIPELFRQLHNHLSTYGDRPPYRLSMEFDIQTKE